MNRKVFLLSLLLTTSLFADPRVPLPKTPDETWQNDLDLRDMIQARSQINGNSVCIDNPTFCVDRVNNLVTQPSQPSFYATLSSSSNVTGNGDVWIISYDTEITDRGDDYNTGTYTFTAPVSGDYLLCASVSFQGFSAGPTICRLRIRTSNRSSVIDTNPGAATEDHLSLCHIMDMDANDTARAELDVSGGTLAVDVSANAQYNQFSGTLLN